MRTRDYLHWLLDEMGRGPVQDAAKKAKGPKGPFTFFDEPDPPKTIPREPFVARGIGATMLYGWHCTEPGPDFPRDQHDMRIPIVIGRPIFDESPDFREYRVRRFLRAGPTSRVFIERGSPTYDGETGAIVECPCDSCMDGHSFPGQAFERHLDPLPDRLPGQAGGKEAG